MTTNVPALSALPPPPDPDNRSTFNALAYPWSLALGTLTTQLAAVAASVKSNADEVVATGQTLAHIINSTVWVSGFNYGQGNAAYDPVNFLTYRRKAAGGSTTRPGLDSGPSGNWALIAGQLNPAEGNAVYVVSGSVVDCSQGVYFTCNLNGSVTFVFSGAPAGRAYGFTLEVNHISGAITWPASVRWAEGAPPFLLAGRSSLFTFVTDDGGTIWRSAFLTNYPS